MMHMRVAAAAVGAGEVFMGAVCAPEDFTVEAPAAVVFMLGAFKVVAVTTEPDVHDQVTQ